MVVTEEEKQQLTALAERAGLSASAWVRLMIRNAYRVEIGSPGVRQRTRGRGPTEPEPR
jgi:hypothetical protein